MNQNIAEQLTAAKWQAVEQYLSDRRPLKYFHAHGAAVEQALCAWWQNIFSGSTRLALLAVGGFGRNELYPHSDLDLAVVSPDDLTDDEQNRITQFVQILWNQNLAPAVKSGSLKQLADSAKHDLTADTAFLEARYLSGCPTLAAQFQTHIQNQRDTTQFIEGKLLEMTQRHAKQPAFALEPNIKNGVGGLRDIHTMMWLARVQDLRTDFSNLQKNQIINHIEYGVLHSSHRVLARLRIDLHLAAGREQDHLTFDLQNTLAANLGYSGDKQQAIEWLMRQYYRAAKNISQLNQIIIPMLRERIYLNYPRITHEIDEHYYQVNHQIAIKNPQLFETQPEYIFGIVQRLQAHHDIDAIAPKTLRAWWTAVQKLNADFYADETHRAQFLSFFQMGTGLSATMRLLNLYGVLAKYLPMWDSIVGLLQHDLFHIYPVDDHILMVLRNVRRLATEAQSHELPFASGLMQQFENKSILYLAALLHDIAKGRNGDHAKLGAADAQRFAADHRLSVYDSDLLVFLVEHHLLLSTVAQKQDIHDPEVLQRFCQIVDSQEKLTALYLLTVADIRGTNPKIWNGWKAQLLETLFQAASRYLAGNHTSRAHIMVSRKQQAFDLLKQNYDEKRIRQLWHALGDTYFAYFDDVQIGWQLPELIEDFQSPCVRIRPRDDRLHVLVFMPNRERLFTRICRIISSTGVDIVAAKALITNHDFILDEFVLQLPEHCGEDDSRRLAQQLCFELTEFAHGRKDAPHRSSQASRRARHQPIVPRVQLAPESERAEWYTLDLVATNRPALLADITEVFARHRARLYHARIATMADRVEDSFLLHAPHWHGTNEEWAFQRDLLAVLG